MSAIPESVWAAARELRGAVNWNSNSSVELIARALMAARKDERERAARIARRKIVGGYLHGAPEWPDGDAIATAILSEDQSHMEADDAS